MSRITLSELKLFLIKEYQYQSLLLRDLAGNFDHDFSGKLEYFEKVWHLHYNRSVNQSEFTLFVEKEIVRSKHSLTLLLRERSFHLMTSIFSVIGILVLVGLFINVAFTSYSIISRPHYIAFLVISILLISSFITIFIWHIQRGNSSREREITLNRYQTFLNELLTNKKEANLFFEQLQKYHAAPLIIIDATPAQLVAFLNAMLKNIVISNTMTNKELAQFFEDKCQQSNGDPYQNLQQMLSQYKNGDRDAGPALSEFIKKLSK